MHKNRITYPEKKMNLYKCLKTFSKKFSVIALIRMENVRASQLLTLRKKLANAKIISIKDRIAKKSFADLAVPGLDRITDSIKGQCVVVFTNISPFVLSSMFKKNKVMLLSRGGDIASMDVVIHAKNTGIAPGPIITDFKENGIPTKIDQGTIWITNETIAVKKGNVISSKLSSILSKLDIKPIEASIELDTALESGIQYNKDELSMDIENYKRLFLDSHLKAISLSIKSGHTTPDTIKTIIVNAIKLAYDISIDSCNITNDNRKQILIKAHNTAQKLQKLL